MAGRQNLVRVANGSEILGELGLGSVNPLHVKTDSGGAGGRDHSGSNGCEGDGIKRRGAPLSMDMTPQEVLVSHCSLAVVTVPRATGLDFPGRESGIMPVQRSSHYKAFTFMFEGNLVRRKRREDQRRPPCQEQVLYRVAE